MPLTYRYKLMPTRAQYRELDQILEAQRLLYNAALQERAEAVRKAKVSISKINQNKSLTKIRAEDETYRTMPVALSRWSISCVDDAMIGIKKLKTKNMTRSAKGTVAEPGKNVHQKAGLNRAMLDASPARMIELLTYKAERAGRVVAKVDPRNTSQDCSCCGVKVDKTLAERVHRCACGTVLDRDVNAARNILQRALVARGRAMPPGDGNVEHWPERRPGNAVSCAA